MEAEDPKERNFKENTKGLYGVLLVYITYPLITR